MVSQFSAVVNDDFWIRPLHPAYANLKFGFNCILASSFRSSLASVIIKQNYKI